MVLIGWRMYSWLTVLVSFLNHSFNRATSRVDDDDIDASVDDDGDDDSTCIDDDDDDGWMDELEKASSSSLIASNSLAWIVGGNGL